LVENSPVAENIEHYGNIVKEKYYLRRIIKVCEEASQQARTAKSEAKEFLAEVEKEFLKIVNEHEKANNGLMSAKLVLMATLEELEKRRCWRRAEWCELWVY
jgi:replicative DNA helicase